MSTRKQRALGAVSAVAALALAGGVAAQFTTSTTSAPQQIGTGTVALALDSVNPVIWTDPLSNLAAGDTAERFVDLRNAGSLKLANLTVSQTNTLGDLLTAPSDISITLQACSVAWNVTTGTCSTGAVGVLGSSSVRAWGSAAKAMSTFEDFGAGEVRHLKVSTQVAPGATNAVQAKSGTITYTFSGTQRAAGVNGTVSESTTILGAPATLTTTPSSTTASAATFSFTDPSNGKAAYTVSWGETGNSAVTPQSTALPAGATSYTLTGLSAGKSYDVALTAQLGVQKTVSTQTYSVPIPAPTAVTVASITSSGAVVSWTDNTSKTASYELTYTPAGGTAQTVSIPAGQSSATLTNLSSAKAYTLSLRAKVGSGYSAAASSSFTTLTAGVDLTKSSWSRMTDMPAEREYATGVVAPNGDMYLIDGSPGLNSSADWYVSTYKASTQRWTNEYQYTATRRPALLASAAMDSAGNIYKFGGKTGYAGTPDTAVDKYVPSTSTWSQAAPMPTARFNSTAVKGSDNNIYVVGGATTYNENVYTGALEMYNPSTNTWTKLPDMPTLAYRASVFADTAGNIYVAGGLDQSNRSVAKLQKFSISQGTWSTISTAVPYLVGYNAVMSLGGDTAYFIGGNDAVVKTYTISTGVWGTGPSLSFARSTTYGLVTGIDGQGRLYVATGNTGVAAKYPERLG